MSDKLVDQLKKVEKQPEQKVEKQELNVVDHIISGNMEKAKAAIQREVINIVSSEVNKKPQ